MLLKQEVLCAGKYSLLWWCFYRWNISLAGHSDTSQVLDEKRPVEPHLYLKKILTTDTYGNNA